MNNSSRDDLYHQLFGDHYRPYYPTLTLDSSRYLVASNDVFNSIVGKLSSATIGDADFLRHFADYHTDFDEVLKSIAHSPQSRHVPFQDVRTFPLIRSPYTFSSSEIFVLRFRLWMHYRVDDINNAYYDMVLEPDGKQNTMALMLIRLETHESAQTIVGEGPRKQFL